MSEQPIYTSKYNPKSRDYNKDGVVDSGDDMLAVQDYDKDGRVSDGERERFRKERDETKTEYKYNAKGELVESKVTGSGKDIPEPGLDFSEYTQKFLANKPDVRRAIKLAVEYGWTQEQFNRYIETKTAWGKNTTDAQAAFDLQVKGSKAEDVNRQVADKEAAILRQAAAAGVQISPEEVKKYARNAVRSALTDEDIRFWIAGKFTMGGEPTPTGPTGPAAPTELTGTAASIGDYLRSMARQYGLPTTDAFLQDKIREGLQQGGAWRDWAEGQRNIFRNQAKTLYPTAGDQLDEYTLDEVLTPYLNAATNLLGIPRQQMNLDDPMWNAALKGEGGPMSLDQWMVKLKTDPKYGWDRTVAARQQAASLGDELLSAFGMA